jgi:hypothetical protein
MQLAEVGDLLLTITPNVYHFEALEQAENYIVWGEEQQGDSIFADNQMELQTIQGTIDYFTKTEFDSAFNLIQEKLNSADLSWRLNSIQREEETGYFHYEWIFEVSD